MPPCYEVRLSHRPGVPLPESLADNETYRDGEVLLVVGEMDQAALYGLLERVRILHLSVLDVRRRRSLPRKGS